MTKEQAIKNIVENHCGVGIADGWQRSKAIDKAKILRELADVINRNSMENECNTPDYILAEYLFGQYEQYCKTVNSTINWHNASEKVR